MNKINVTVYNEFHHEKIHDYVQKVYPDGIHAAIKDALDGDGRFETSVATFEMDEHGLTEEVLSRTDVLFWWAHCLHEPVLDEVVERIHKRVLEGMGLVVLHSGHASKIFRKLMGTGCKVKWRESDDLERIWVVDPSHPIAAGLPEFFELEREEMYGEHFDIPTPDDVVFASWFSGGELIRSGCCFERGNGKIFYFRPGHESYPTFYDENIRKVLVNAALWASSNRGIRQTYGHFPTENYKK